jgi:small subunit ribosomal protein S8
MMTDPIADMLTRIRNAGLARHDRTEVPASHLKEALAHILKSEGFIADVRPSESAGGGDGTKQLTIVLKYGRDRQSAIDGVRRVSRPGRRVYSKIRELPRVYSGLGVSILSTPRGVLSDQEARAANVGGEVLCRVF